MFEKLNFDKRHPIIIEMSNHEFYSEEVLFSGDEETSYCLTVLHQLQ